MQELKDEARKEAEKLREEASELHAITVKPRKKLRGYVLVLRPKRLQ